MSLTLHTYSDGGARGNPGPAAIGVVLCDPQGKIIQEASQPIGETTNNQAEYRAMIWALELAAQRQAKRLLCHADSELLVYQLQGLYRIKNAHLKALADQVKGWVVQFESVTFRQIPRTHPLIARADRLLNKTLDRAHAKAPPRTVLVHRKDIIQSELFKEGGAK